jgi:fibronectin type 3 domain-containing protein
VTVNVASIGALGTYNLITGASGISAGSFQLGTAPAGYTYALSASNGTLSLAVSVPPAPTGVTATAGTGEVALSWNPSIGATSYDLQRTRTSGSGYALIASVVSGTTYTDSAVTNETTYYYVVSGSNAGGEGPNSSEVSAKPYIPIAPSELYPPAMAMVTMSGTSDWQFTIQTVAGRTYQLQWTNSLNPTNWQDEGAVVTGTGGPLMLEDPVNPAIPDRMYRILIQP